MRYTTTLWMLIAFLFVPVFGTQESTPVDPVTHLTPTTTPDALEAVSAESEEAGEDDSERSAAIDIDG